MPETVLQTFPVVKQFDISEYICLHLLYCIIFPPACQLLFKTCKKAFRAGDRLRWMRRTKLSSPLNLPLLGKGDRLRWMRRTVYIETPSVCSAASSLREGAFSVGGSHARGSPPRPAVGVHGLFRSPFARFFILVKNVYKHTLKRHIFV